MCLFNTHPRHSTNNSKEVKKRRKSRLQEKGKSKPEDQMAQSKEVSFSFPSDKEPSSRVPRPPHQTMSTHCTIHNATTTGHPKPTFAKDVYILPKSMAQVGLPVVDYSPERRIPGSDWPSCYMAITLDCTTPEDIVAILAPPGSGLTVRARLLDCTSSALYGFRDASAIRRHSLQLEIYKETVAGHASRRHG